MDPPAPGVTASAGKGDHTIYRIVNHNLKPDAPVPDSSPNLAPPGVIYLKERSLKMLKKDLILRNPLRLMGYETEDILPEGGFGAVLARAGVGKTSFVVQLALNSLLRKKNVLHISLNDPVEKVCLWYEEVFRNIAGQYEIDNIDRLWETILPQRLIMTFRVDGFSVPKLKERLADLTGQNIFFPGMILIDGFPFEEDAKQALTELKSMALQNRQHVWFTLRTHRHENTDPEKMPDRIKPVSDLFDAIIQLQPVDKEIHVRDLKKNPASPERPMLFLDPTTMLIKRKK